MSTKELPPFPWYWEVDAWRGGYSGIFDANGNEVLVPNHANDGDSGAAWFEDYPSDEVREYIIEAVNNYKGGEPLIDRLRTLAKKANLMLGVATINDPNTEANDIVITSYSIDGWKIVGGGKTADEALTKAEKKLPA